LFPECFETIVFFARKNMEGISFSFKMTRLQKLSIRTKFFAVFNRHFNGLIAGCKQKIRLNFVMTSLTKKH